MAEFNPLKSVAVKGAGQLEARGLVVVVGPNSAGKTRFLKDIRGTLLGSAEKSIVCTDVEIEFSMSIDALLEHVEKKEHLRRTIDGNGNEVFRQWSPHIEGAEQGWSLSRATAEHHFKEFKSLQPGARTRFLKHLGQMFVTSLFLDRRLDLASEKDGFDCDIEPPTCELHSLYMRAESQSRLTAEIRNVFDKGIWVSTARLKKIVLKVSDEPDIPTAEERSQAEAMKKHRQIDAEGDGLRSYAAIVISLLTGNRPIMLIDEPEMCLHPPQAYSLGQFIGRNSTSKDHSVFVATHSSHLLRGIVETANELTILRLVNVDGQFSGTVLPDEVLREIIRRPTTKIETILDGIFSNAVAIVESEGDRLVYGTAWERLREVESQSNDTLRHDVHFVSMGGLSGVASACKLFSKLQIPTAVIADLDLIANPEMKAVMNVIAPNKCTHIWDKCKKMVQDIRGPAPTISVQNVQQRLKALSEAPLDWGKDDDDKLRRDLLQLADELSWSTNLKRGGLASFKDSNKPIYHQLDAIISECQRYGLFLAHVGTLEYWLEALMDQVGKRKKAEWANEAAVKIKTATPTGEDIWEFLRSVVKFQQGEIAKAASFTG